LKKNLLPAATPRIPPTGETDQHQRLG